MLCQQSRHIAEIGQFCAQHVGIEPYLWLLERNALNRFIKSIGCRLHQLGMECTGNCQRNRTGFLFLANGCGCFYCCLVASDDSLHAGVIVCRNNIAVGCCTNFFYFFRLQLHNGTHCTICLLCSGIHCFRTSLDDPKTVFERQHASCHHRCIFAQRMPCNRIKCITLFLCCSQAAERSCHDCRLCVNRTGEGFCFAVLNDFLQVKS